MGLRGALAAVVVMAVVVLGAGPVGAQEGCGVPAAPGWTRVEAAVWRQLCAGHPADFNPQARTVEENLDPHQPEGWDQTRVLSSAFVERLLNPPYASALDRHGIFLVGAWFPDVLDISEATTSFPLRCQYCRIAGLDATEAVIDGTLDLRGSAVEGDLTLLAANIAGDLLVSDGAAVTGRLFADGLTVAGGVFLRDGSRFADIRLPGAHIGGNLEVNGESVVSGTLAAEQATVTGNMFLRDGSRFAGINLRGADIGGLIVLEGAVWEPGGALDLSQARAGGVFTDEQAGSLPARLDLDGFTFPQWAGPDPGTLRRGWFTDIWLARMPEFRPGPYTHLADVMDAAGHPTIADDLRYHRNTAQRQLVPWTRPDRWGRQLHWLVLGYGLRPWRALGWLAAVWLTGLLVFWLRPRLRPPRERVRSRPRRWLAYAATLGRLRLAVRDGWSAGLAALYSLDRLVPAVKLVSPDHIPDRTRPQHAWAVAEQLLGWLLTLFLVGWLGSLLV